LSVESLRSVIEPLSDIMFEHSQGFGYRMIKESVQYHSVAVHKLERPAVDIIDELLVQKLLVKLHGDENNRSMLDGLTSLLTPYSKAVELLKKLEDDLDTFESFQNSR
jgi:hypothetical protein